MAPTMSKPMMDMPRFTFLHQIALVKTWSSSVIVWSDGLRCASSLDVLWLRSVSSD